MRLYYDTPTGYYQNGKVIIKGNFNRNFAQRSFAGIPNSSQPVVMKQTTSTSYSLKKAEDDYNVAADNLKEAQNGYAHSIASLNFANAAAKAASANAAAKAASANSAAADAAAAAAEAADVATAKAAEAAYTAAASLKKAQDDYNAASYNLKKAQTDSKQG